VLISQDPRWARETVPPSLKALCGRLCSFFGIPAGHVGTKGNSAHCSGYHRSRDFLLHSPFSENRTYSVTEPGNGGGSGDWVCAFDISLPEAALIAMCKRLDQAVRAGRLEKVAEWYGNDDGDNRVDGYDNIRNRVSSSDPSHLWHAHVSIIRSRANDNHDDIYDVLTGGADDMEPTTKVPIPSGIPKYLGAVTEPTAGWLWHAIYLHLTGLEKVVAGNAAASVTRDAVTVAAVTALSKALSAGTGASVDVALILQAIHAEAEKSRAIAVARAEDTIKALHAAATSLGA
jgi:hypothetical protein